MSLPRLPISPEAAFIVLGSNVAAPLYALYLQRSQRAAALEERRRHEEQQRKLRAEADERRRRRGY